MVSLIIIILAIACAAVGIHSFITKRNYENSNYKRETGNNFKEVGNDKGKYGEYLSFNKLEKIEGAHRILANVYLPTEKGGTTEADIIYLHESGIYVLESKNYSGWIFGSESDKNWTQVFKNRHKEKFFNPIWQNNAHINNLARILGIDKSLVKSLIVFSERCTLKKISVDSENVHVIKRENLVSTIQDMISRSNVKLEEGQIIEYYYKLKNYSNVSDEVKAVHINNINEKRNKTKNNIKKSKTESNADYVEYELNRNHIGYQDNNVKTSRNMNCSTNTNIYNTEKYYDNKPFNKESNYPDYDEEKMQADLRHYRTVTSKEEGVPAYVIFSNAEIDSIVNNKPRSIEELKNISGFGQKKCQKYGHDIINIVMKNAGHN